MQRPTMRFVATESARRPKKFRKVTPATLRWLGPKPYSGFHWVRLGGLPAFILLYATLYAAFGVASPSPRFFEARGISASELGVLLGLGTLGATGRRSRDRAHRGHGPARCGQRSRFVWCAPRRSRSVS